MAWIESHQSLREHPKTKRLCRLLKIDRHKAVGMLHFLWWWAYDYVPEGDLSTFSDDDIADAVDWDGEASELVGALTASGFIDDERTLHDWWDYAQKWIERRRANTARMRAARASGVDNTCAARATDVRCTCGARVERPEPDQPDQPNQTGQTGQTNTSSDDDLPSSIVESIPVERQLFDYYRERIQPAARTFTASKIKARLKTFNADELRAAVDKFASAQWWMEHNGHQGADWFFRNDAQIERFLNLKPESKSTLTTNRRQSASTPRHLQAVPATPGPRSAELEKQRKADTLARLRANPELDPQLLAWLEAEEQRERMAQ